MKCLRAVCVGLGAATVAVGSAAGQTDAGLGLQAGPQYMSYRLGSPVSSTISEFALPIYVLLPATNALSFDVGTSFASVTVNQGANGSSSISGLTDTQVRANYTIGTDFVVLTAGVNVPTGRSTVTPDQQVAAGLIANDFLVFPISSMGTGFGGTAGVAIARSLSGWNVGAGASMRKSTAYTPFQTPDTVPALHYQPGNEYRARVGVDHGVGTGRVSLGLTYSTFGNDELSGSIYNTGDRLISQFGYDNALRGGTLMVSAWDLFRKSGTLAGGAPLGQENVADGSVAYGFATSGIALTPTAELRSWAQQGQATSVLMNLDLRARLSVHGAFVTPSAGYGVGKIASSTSSLSTASLTGYHAALGITLTAR